MGNTPIVLTKIIAVQLLTVYPEQPGNKNYIWMALRPFKCVIQETSLRGLRSKLGAGKRNEP